MFLRSIGERRGSCRIPPGLRRSCDLWSWGEVWVHRLRLKFRLGILSHRCELIDFVRLRELAAGTSAWWDEAVSIVVHPVQRLHHMPRPTLHRLRRTFGSLPMAAKLGKSPRPCDRHYARHCAHLFGLAGALPTHEGIRRHPVQCGVFTEEDVNVLPLLRPLPEALFGLPCGRTGTRQWRRSPPSLRSRKAQSREGEVKNRVSSQAPGQEKSYAATRPDGKVNSATRLEPNELKSVGRLERRVPGIEIQVQDSFEEGRKEATKRFLEEQLSSWRTSNPSSLARKLVELLSSEFSLSKLKNSVFQS
mmetsp:Transcript_55999/g.122418  ORF Transcript_55999/g.122418 Transcript_55999/m.122418 type:complete len:305 (-) Transcript_55999:204-1118(-)